MCQINNVSDKQSITQICSSIAPTLLFAAECMWELPRYLLQGTTMWRKQEQIGEDEDDACSNTNPAVDGTKSIH